ncbi:hypothetical protein [Streptomyces sp. 3N207]|uniref:hypothetical protein n=1 Tax=Streptomyces sp. 3N207 TaxID=3457417 RepID=UPI003FD1ECCC
MPHPDLDQVVEVIVAGRSGAYDYGSGYRLGRTLIVTSRHLLTDTANGVEVRLGAAGEWLPAEVVWRAHSPGLDVALLALRADLAPSPLLNPPRLGLLHPEPARTVAVTATGFPRFTATSDAAGQPVRDSYQLTGHIASHSHRKTGHLELNRDGRPLTRGEKWAGMSGGSVFAHGMLIGVVVSAQREDVPLTACSLAPLGAEPEAGTLDPETAASADAFWGLLAADGVDARCHPALRRPSYADHIRQRADRVGTLRDREAELAAIYAFARSGEPYCWIVGPPWAGKSALAACAASRPPADIDVVAFFVSRGSGAQTGEFRQEICDQLSALLDEERQIMYTQADLESLWYRACGRAERLGRHLLLLVDGLDENDEHPPIAALLPTRTGARGHVLLLSRRLPPVPVEVAPDHPLRDEARCPRVELTPSPYAGRLRDRATADVAGLLRDGGARQALGLLAIAGPMTVDELAGVLDVDRCEVADITRSAPARVLVAGGASGEERFAYGHEELRRTVLGQLGEAAAHRYRAALHTWAGRYAKEGWPDSTPAYLLDHYPALLTASRETGRLAVLPSPERLALWQRRVGHDAFAVAELSMVLHALAAEEAPDLAAVCVLAWRRYQMVDRLGSSRCPFPAEIPVAWARQGQWRRAEYLAAHIWRRTEAFVGMAEIAAQAEDTERFRKCADQSEKPSSWGSRLPGAEAALLARLAAASWKKGDQTSARTLLGEVESRVRDPKCHAQPMDLARIALCAARAGHRDMAERLLGEAAGHAGQKAQDPEWAALVVTALVEIRGHQAVLAGPSAAFREMGVEYLVTKAVTLALIVRGAAGADEPIDAAALLTEAERALVDRAGALAPAGEGERADRDDLARAAAYVAVAAADVGEAALASRLTGLALSHVGDGDPAESDETRGHVARACESVGDVRSADDLLGAMERGERGPALLTALVGCVDAARDCARVLSLLESAERALPSPARRTEPDNAHEYLAAAAARNGHPAIAERIMARADPLKGMRDWDRWNLNAVLSDIGYARPWRGAFEAFIWSLSSAFKDTVKGPQEDPSALTHGAEEPHAGTTDADDLGPVYPEPMRVWRALRSARRAARRGNPGRARNKLERAVQGIDAREAADPETDRAFSDIAAAAADIGDLTLAEDLLKRIGDASFRTPVMAAIAGALERAGDHDGALARVTEAFHYWLRSTGGPRQVQFEAIYALFKVAVSIDPLTARRMSAEALATDLDTPKYLAHAVRVDPGLAERIHGLLVE